ncbi:MAG TPA: MFS transporter [Gemmataceae bacterium]|nr:MFS transporter [Gemmataceae bacterium]
MTDGPEQASWLAPAERSWLADRIVGEKPTHLPHDEPRFLELLLDSRVWLLAALFTLVAAGISALGYYLPELIRWRSPSLDKFQIGLFAAIPSLGTMIGMVAIAAHSDRSGERRWHVAGSVLLAAAGWAASAWLPAPLPSLLCLALAQMGMMSALGPFWSSATSYLSFSSTLCPAKSSQVLCRQDGLPILAENMVPRHIGYALVLLR